MKKHHVLSVLLIIGFLFGFTLGLRLNPAPALDREPTVSELLGRVTK